MAGRSTSTTWQRRGAGTSIYGNDGLWNLTRPNKGALNTKLEFGQDSLTMLLMSKCLFN